LDAEKETVLLLVLLGSGRSCWTLVPVSGPGLEVRDQVAVQAELASKPVGIVWKIALASHRGAAQPPSQ